MFDGFFVKLEEYVLRWAITGTIWMGIGLVAFQFFPAAVEFVVWISGETVARSGFLGPEYTHFWDFLIAVLLVLNIVSFVSVLIQGWFTRRMKRQIEAMLQRGECSPQTATPHLN